MGSRKCTNIRYFVLCLGCLNIKPPFTVMSLRSVCTFLQAFCYFLELWLNGDNLLVILYVTVVLVGMPLTTVLWLSCSSGTGGCVPRCSGVFLGVFTQEGQRLCEYSLCGCAFGLFHNLSFIKAGCFFFPPVSVFLWYSLVFIALYCVLIIPSPMYLWERKIGSRI